MEESTEATNFQIGGRVTEATIEQKEKIREIEWVLGWKIAEIWERNGDSAIGVHGGLCEDLLCAKVLGEEMNGKSKEEGSLRFRGCWILRV